MDLCLYAKNNAIPAAEVAEALGLSERQVERVFADIEAKRRATRALHLPPCLVSGVSEVGR
jgi:NAD+ synthase